jgi:hypothetical protein
MPGIVIEDLGGGDNCINFVDDELWDQIVALDRGIKADTYAEIVKCLCSADPELKYPPYPQFENAPMRKGKVLRCLYTQDFVIELPDEEIEVGRIRGVLTLP